MDLDYDIIDSDDTDYASADWEGYDYAEAELAQWDDDPSPYDGTYSED